MGVKLRRHASLAPGPPAMRSVKGDYLCLNPNHALLTALSKQGDHNVLFADTVAKVNRHNRIVPRLMAITESSICIFECNTFRLKRRILLKNMDSLYLSELPDNFLGIIVPDESDLLLVSTRKTEIVTVLVEATKKNTHRDLDVHFSNTFTVCLDPETHRQVKFSQVSSGVSTTISTIGPS
jgi:hypothetical protein